MISFIDAYRSVLGVEPICRLLPIAPGVLRIDERGISFIIFAQHGNPRLFAVTVTTVI